MAAPEPRDVRDIVYETFATEGRAPSPAELARRTSTPVGDVHRVLHELAADHALVLNTDGDAPDLRDIPDVGSRQVPRIAPRPSPGPGARSPRPRCSRRGGESSGVGGLRQAAGWPWSA